MKKYLVIGGGILAAVSAFLPFVKLAGISATLMDYRASAAYIFLVMGGLILAVGLLGKRWLHILSLLLGLCVAGLAVVYMGDAKKLGAEAGIAIYAQLVGGILAVAGSVMAMMKPKTIA